MSNIVAKRRKWATKSGEEDYFHGEKVPTIRSASVSEVMQKVALLL